MSTARRLPTCSFLLAGASAAVALACVEEDAFFPPLVVIDAGAAADAGAGGGAAGGAGDPLGLAGRFGQGVGGAAGSSGRDGVSNDAGGGTPAGGAAGTTGAVGEPCDEPCPCDSGEFGTPELVSGLDVSGALFGPAFSADARTLFFSAVEADENIYSATRLDRGAAFSSAVLVPNIDAGGSDEGTPFLTFDGLALYFFSTRPGPGAQGDRDLWLSERASVEAEFGAPRVVPAVNGAGLEHLPRLTRDELTLAFVSGRPAENAASNIWFAQRESEDEPFGTAQELPGINTDAREEGFSLSADGLTLYFASDRRAPLDMDLWVATRPDANGTFGPPRPLEQLNTDAQDLDPALSPDGFELFFSSTRNGQAQLFRASRICDP